MQCMELFPRQPQADTSQAASSQRACQACGNPHPLWDPRDYHGAHHHAALGDPEFWRWCVAQQANR